MIYWKTRQISECLTVTSHHLYNQLSARKRQNPALNINTEHENTTQLAGVRLSCDSLLNSAQPQSDGIRSKSPLNARITQLLKALKLLLRFHHHKNNNNNNNAAIIITITIIIIRKAVAVLTTSPVSAVLSSSWACERSMRNLSLWNSSTVLPSPWALCDKRGRARQWWI